MARKVKCKNTECKHHCKNDYCDTTVNINSGGRCESFEKNIVYYIHLVWEALANKNFIDMIEIIRNPEIKIGLFYVMDCFNLGFSEMEWGTCRMVMLKDREDGKPLNYEEIISREIDTEDVYKRQLFQFLLHVVYGAFLYRFALQIFLGRLALYDFASVRLAPFNRFAGSYPVQLPEKSVYSP